MANHTVTLGGDRLGAGKKEKLHLKNYERSTHDLSYAWRSTMSAGTLVPFLTEMALPGDTFDIDLNVDVMTHPTIGPLFGSYKVQLDLFQVPIRLYQAKLHMNMLKIGMDMASVKLPQVRLQVPNLTTNSIIRLVDEGRLDTSQVNPSNLLAHLDINGIGTVITSDPYGTIKTRDFNALPILAYWDIYKNYYANKQEEIGMYISDTAYEDKYTIDKMEYGVTVGTYFEIPEFGDPSIPNTLQPENFESLWLVTEMDIPTGALMADMVQWLRETITIRVHKYGATPYHKEILLKDIDYINIIPVQFGTKLRVSMFGGTLPNDTPWEYGQYYEIQYYRNQATDPTQDITTELKVKSFPLENIDNMRVSILQHVGNDPFILDNERPEPYNHGTDISEKGEGLERWWESTRLLNQGGLALKTYQSDLFNNWVSTEWITGDNGINAITRVDTSDGGFNIDELNLSNKIYNMLMRIAVTGGSYDDWLDATYTHERVKQVENPIYAGGISRELYFAELNSNAAALDSQGTNQPLGTLAGKGEVSKSGKGGKSIIKVHEPSVIMGIISLTPRIDYSQGNKWHNDLQTMDDFHKPALDQIGFQDLIAEQMHWATTRLTSTGWRKQSVGKQPAWVNYMTNVNKVRGNFADQHQQMWMTLNRKYKYELAPVGQSLAIKFDATTYIDPSKFNHIFADTRLDAQNFWAQIAVGITARRKMSAKLIPNL